MQTTVQGEGETISQGKLVETNVQGEDKKTVEGKSETTALGEGETTVQRKSERTIQGENTATVQGRGETTLMNLNVVCVILQILQLQYRSSDTCTE